jgi:hypothetical protein
MHAPTLGPHTFLSPPHERHHEWLTHFTPEERRQLIEEDFRARLQFVGVIVGAMCFGFAMLLTVLLFAL